MEGKEEIALTMNIQRKRLNINIEENNRSNQNRSNLESQMNYKRQSVSANILVANIISNILL